MCQQHNRFIQHTIEKYFTYVFMTFVFAHMVSSTKMSLMILTFKLRNFNNDFSNFRKITINVDVMKMKLVFWNIVVCYYESLYIQNGGPCRSSIQIYGQTCLVHLPVKLRAVLVIFPPELQEGPLSYRTTKKLVHFHAKLWAIMGISPLELKARGKSHIFKGCFLWIHGSNRNPKGTTYLSIGTTYPSLDSFLLNFPLKSSPK